MRSAEVGQRYYFPAGVERLFGVQCPLSIANIRLKLAAKIKGLPVRTHFNGGERVLSLVSSLHRTKSE